VQEPVLGRHDLAEEPDEREPIQVVEDDRPSVDAARRDVVDPVGEEAARQPRHASNVAAEVAAGALRHTFVTVSVRLRHSPEPVPVRSGSVPRLPLDCPSSVPGLPLICPASVTRPSRDRPASVPGLSRLDAGGAARLPGGVDASRGRAGYGLAEMRLAAFLLALALPASASSAPPRAGVFEPGRSLGGLRLGMTGAQVKAAWGNRFGRCRSCPRTTWYFNYRAFSPRGAGVEFLGGRVSAVFTVWSPRGWRTPRGLRLGDDARRIAELYGPLARVECGVYTAHLLRRGPTVSAFYETGNRVWAFALLRFPASPCR
jgi:hypothetical protein